ncbi:nitrogen regulation protein NR(I) [Ahrensia sp. R2A130]|uniref:nitrogen regulation protein NR(I) n=1 Tax=Ahrensia sp. R2A130 TaxID=744979 RepID=UPI0001E0B45C|nr:nitrogen regulation protein NR(I) [Ahrensia sp. R2A130]EFL90137.1 nitrogen regulation protein [Ahrensia sp. R2A130]
MAEILVADDDSAIRTVVSQALTRAGYEVRVTSNAATLWRWTQAGDGDLIVTDVIMPDENAFELLPRIKRIRPDLPVIVMSAQNTFMTAITATEKGAYDYLPKPFDLKELVSTVERALAQPVGTATKSAPDEPRMPLVGRSPAMQDIYRVIARMTQTDLTVLINGESGTGKELVAKALHEFGKRKNGPFVAINMAAIPRELIESELFGHEKGAFTGAESRSAGRFEQAEGGTLFLDEIGDMPLEAQTRLLRVLQEGEYSTVGGRKAIPTDVRIVAATHQDLTALIDSGQFREDLFYRLNVVPLRVPPLRERGMDVPDLARHFLELAHDNGLPLKAFTSEALDRLRAHNWPGNVRELENLVQRLVALHPQEQITGELVDSELRSVRPRGDMPAGMSAEGELDVATAISTLASQALDADSDEAPLNDLYQSILREVEEPLLRVVLKATRGNQIKAARILGLNRNTLRKKLKELDMPVTRGIG